jgi:hypothetical protein
LDNLAGSLFPIKYLVISKLPANYIKRALPLGKFKEDFEMKNAVLAVILVLVLSSPVFAADPSHEQINVAVTVTTGQQVEWEFTSIEALSSCVSYNATRSNTTNSIASTITFEEAGELCRHFGVFKMNHLERKKIYGIYPQDGINAIVQNSSRIARPENYSLAPGDLNIFTPPFEHGYVFDNKKGGELWVWVDEQTASQLPDIQSVSFKCKNGITVEGRLRANLFKPEPLNNSEPLDKVKPPVVPVK